MLLSVLTKKRQAPLGAWWSDLSPGLFYQVIGEIGYQLVALPSLLMRPARVQLRVVDVVPGEVVSSMPRLGLAGLCVPAVSLLLLLLGLQMGGGAPLRLLQWHGLDAVEEGRKWREPHDGFAAVLALECRRTLRTYSSTRVLRVPLYVLDSCCAELLLACVILVIYKLSFYLHVRKKVGPTS